MKEFEKNFRQPQKSDDKDKKRLAEHRVLLDKIISDLVDENVELIPLLTIGKAKNEKNLEENDVLGEIILDLSDDEIPLIIATQRRAQIDENVKRKHMHRKPVLEMRRNYFSNIHNDTLADQSDSEDIIELIPVATIIKSKKHPIKDKKTRADILVEEINELTSRALQSIYYPTRMGEKSTLDLESDKPDIYDSKDANGEKAEMKSLILEEESRENTSTKDHNLLRYYDILGIKQNATTEDIVTAYREMILKHHPDRLHNSDKGAREMAEKKAKQITKAYRVVRNEKVREECDNKLISHKTVNGGTYT